MTRREASVREKERHIPKGLQRTRRTGGRRRRRDLTSTEGRNNKQAPEAELHHGMPKALGRSNYRDWSRSSATRAAKQHNGNTKGMKHEHYNANRRPQPQVDGICVIQRATLILEKGRDANGHLKELYTRICIYIYIYKMNNTHACAMRAYVYMYLGCVYVCNVDTPTWHTNRNNDTHLRTNETRQRC